ncbi:hypothetical protein J6590_057940 [Homalodisca vitripennis]|nr:hypothetical protein J6590_057940 [Homalodisca vitripennis]
MGTLTEDGAVLFAVCQLPLLHGADAAMSCPLGWRNRRSQEPLNAEEEPAQELNKSSLSKPILSMEQRSFGGLNVTDLILFRFQLHQNSTPQRQTTPAKDPDAEEEQAQELNKCSLSKPF